MTCDGYLLPILREVGNLRRAMQTLDIVIRWHHYKETIGNWACAVLCTQMQWQTPVSHIPFSHPKPIIDISPIHVTTKLMTFTKSTGARPVYINLVDSSRMGFRVRNIGFDYTQATMTGKTKPFGHHWRVIHLISVVLIVSLARMDPKISFFDMNMDIPFWGCTHGQTEPVHAEDSYSCACKGFPREDGPNTSAWDSQGDDIQSVRGCIAVGAPKLASLRQYLQNPVTVKENGEQVMLWVCWPLTQWLVKQVSISTLCHSQ